MEVAVITEPSSLVDNLLLIVAIFYILCFLVGLLLNSLLAKAAFTSKELRGVPHTLIGIRSVCDILHQSGHLPLLYSFVKEDSITQKQCYYLQFIPILAILVGGAAVFLLCIDRVTAVLWPLRYRTAQSRSTVRTMLKLGVAGAIAAAGLVLAYEDTHSDKKVVCSIPAGLGPRPRLIFVLTLFVVAFLMAILYLISAGVLKKHTCPSKRRRCIFRSVLWCALISLVGWVLTALLNLILMVHAEFWMRKNQPEAITLDGGFLFLSQATIELLTQPTPRCLLLQIASGIILNLLCTMTYFAYFCLSCDYRRALRSQWATIGWHPFQSLSETDSTEVKPALV
ncbi:unnamed protein product, partial [Mesorhabditis belari]|uniref:G-protein coupled receptors family 1 profile domain-containing protein n=1 Tax=Mesorhabditis belari TaxID=2138241 RepID=A0AAF3FF45_9BILA